MNGKCLALCFVLSTLTIPVLRNNPSLSCVRSAIVDVEKYFGSIWLVFLTASQGHVDFPPEEDDVFR